MTSRFLSWWVAVALFWATGIYAGHETPYSADQPPEILRVFPDRLGPWTCRASGEPGGYADPGVDAAWAGRCENDRGTRLTVYIGYRGRQADNQRLLSPRLVYPDGDQGWNYIASDAVTISTAEGRMLRANLTVLQHARGRQEAVLYWYQRGETSFGDDYGYRLALLESNLMLRETSAVVVRISTMLRGPSLAASFEAEEHLAALLFSAVRSSWL